MSIDPRQIAEMFVLGGAAFGTGDSDDDSVPLAVAMAPPPVPKKRAPPKKKVAPQPTETDVFSLVPGVTSLVYGGDDAGAGDPSSSSLPTASVKAPRKRAPPKPKGNVAASSFAPPATLTLLIDDDDDAPLSLLPSVFHAQSSPGPSIPCVSLPTGTPPTSASGLLCNNILHECMGGGNGPLTLSTLSTLTTPPAALGGVSSDDEDLPLMACRRDSSANSSRATSPRQASMESTVGLSGLTKTTKPVKATKAKKDVPKSAAKASSSALKPPKKVAATQDEVNVAVLAWFRREMKPATPQSCVDGLQSKYSKTFVLRALEELMANNSLAIKDIKKTRLFFLNREKTNGSKKDAVNGASVAHTPTATPASTNMAECPLSEVAAGSGDKDAGLESTLESELVILEREVAALTDQNSQMSRLQLMLSSLRPTDYYRKEIAVASAELETHDVKLKRIEDSLKAVSNPNHISSISPSETTPSSSSSGARQQPLSGGRDLGWFKLKRPRAATSTPSYYTTTAQPAPSPVLNARTMAQDALALIKQWIVRKRLCHDMLESLNQQASSSACNGPSLMSMLTMDEDCEERLTPEMCRDRIPKQLLQTRQ